MKITDGYVTTEVMNLSDRESCRTTTVKQQLFRELWVVSGSIRPKSSPTQLDPT